MIFLVRWFNIDRIDWDNIFHTMDGNFRENTHFDDKYALVISKEGETFYSSLDKGLSLKHFGVSAEFTSAFYGLKSTLPNIDLLIEEAMERFTLSLENINKLHLTMMNDLGVKNKNKPHYSLSDYWTDREEDWFWYLMEYTALKLAVKLWLKPKKLKDGYDKRKTEELFKENSAWLSEKEIIDPDVGLLWYCYTKRNTLNKVTLIQRYMTETFRFRISNVGKEILVVSRNGSPSPEYLYRSNNLLDLAWSEIYWAIEKNRYANVCNVCGRVFALGNQYGKQACSKECDKKRKGKNFGREYYREKMRESRQKTNNRSETKGQN